MASGKRYIITSIANIKAALLDKYGLYNSSTNPNGVIVHYESSISIIFTCRSICDKVIRFYNITYGYCAFGDAWVSGDSVTNQVLFGGDNFGSAPVEKELILTNNCFVANWYKATDTYQANDRLIVIGKLTNGKYICFGAYQNGAYQTNLKAYITNGVVEVLPVTGVNSLLSSTGEIYKTKVYFGSLLNIAEVNPDGTLAYLLDVESAYYKSTHLSATSTYVMTSSLCGIGGFTRGIVNSLIIELAA